MKTEIPGLKKQVILRFIMVPVFMGLMLFLPAGTLYYWQAWLYCSVLLIPASLVVFYFFKKNPEFLERRMRLREKEEKQKTPRYSGLLFSSPVS